MLIGFLAIIAILGVVAERSGLPYPTALVLGGVVLGLIPGLPRVRLQPDLVLLGFIPILVYAAAFEAASFDLRRYALRIISLATGLVLLTVGVAGAVSHLVGGIAWGSAFVAGALAAPTDPVSATAVISHVGAPEQIVTILEGESLINDGTGLAVYQVAVAAVGGSFSVGHAAVKLLEISAGGVAIGLAVGWIAVWLRRQLDSPSIEVVLGLLAAFGSYTAAYAAGFSGVLAAVMAGLYTGWHAQDISSPQSRLRMEPVWDAATFVLQSIMFLLIGLELRRIVAGIPAGQAQTAIFTAVTAIFAVVALRFAWMLGAGMLSARGLGPPPLMSRLWPAAERSSRRELVVLGWSGMRGALSLAGALSIPLSTQVGRFPARDEVIFLVYCVVLGTLIVPSLTLELLVRRLGLGQTEGLREQERRARARVAHAALSRLEEIAEEADVPEDLVAGLRGIYELRLSRLESESPESPDAQDEDSAPRAQEIRDELAAAQRRALARIRHERAASTEVVARIRHDIDLEQARG